MGPKTMQLLKAMRGQLGTPRQAVAWTRWQRPRASAWTLPRMISTVACKISYGPDAWSRTPTPLHRLHGGCTGSRLPGWMPRTAISIGR